MKTLIASSILGLTIIVAGSQSTTPPCPPLGTFVLKKTIVNGVEKHGTQQIVRPATTCAEAHWYRIHVEQGTILIQGHGDVNPIAGIPAGGSIDIPSGNFEMTIEHVGDVDARGSYEIIPTPVATPVATPRQN